MANAWLNVPLEDYEGHMGSAEVGQLRVLAELFHWALRHCHPDSVAVLGVAGGNGLEYIDCSVTKRIVGVDVNQQYLDQVQRRYGLLPGLELHCCDLNAGGLRCAPVAMVHAALILEHAGMGSALESAVGLVACGGYLSVVLQLPSPVEAGVAATRYTSMQSLKRDFALIDRDEMRAVLGARGLRLVAEQFRELPAGKSFWLGVFRA